MGIEPGDPMLSHQQTKSSMSFLYSSSHIPQCHLKTSAGGSCLSCRWSQMFTGWRRRKGLCPEELLSCRRLHPTQSWSLAYWGSRSSMQSVAAPPQLPSLSLLGWRSQRGWSSQRSLLQVRERDRQIQLEEKVCEPFGITWISARIFSKIYSDFH